MKLIILVLCVLFTGCFSQNGNSTTENTTSVNTTVQDNGTNDILNGKISEYEKPLIPKLDTLESIKQLFENEQLTFVIKTENGSIIGFLYTDKKNRSNNKHFNKFGPVIFTNHSSATGILETMFSINENNINKLVVWVTWMHEIDRIANDQDKPSNRYKASIDFDELNRQAALKSVFNNELNKVETTVELYVIEKETINEISRRKMDDYW